MTNLRVAAIAPPLVPGAVETNLIRVETLVREAARAQAPDLIVLPEDLSPPRRLGRGSTQANDVVRPVEGALLHLLRQLARESDCVIGGGARLVRGSHAYLTYLLVEPDGRVHLHDQGNLSPAQRLTLRAGDDDGITSVVAWGRRRVGLLCGAEWDDPAHLQRLRDAGVELLIGGRHGSPQVVELESASLTPAEPPTRPAVATLASTLYWGRRLARSFPWQDCPGTDVPDECGPTRFRRPRAAEREVVVTDRTEPAPGVVRLQLSPTAGTALPRWEPGAHLDLVLPDGLVRQYSLCGDPDAREYEIAVLDVTDGRGGSRWIHDNLTVGQELCIRGPRNHFPFDETRAALFVAGGIGITPLAPMIRRAHAIGLDWQLLYGGRSRTSMAFADDLAGLDEARVELVPQDTAGLLDLAAALNGVPADGVVYACGPPAMLAAVEMLVAELPESTRPELRLERFTAAPVDSADDVGFRIKLASTGTTIDVPANQRALDVLLAAGAVIDNSCRNGLCGSCAVRVLDGTPDHRDALPDAARGDRMMVCVSRALTAEITLDV